MAVRNFWMDANVDGRATALSGGPRSKDGGMDATIYVRDQGRIERAFSFICSERDGRLVVTVHDHAGMEVHRIETER